MSAPAPQQQRRQHDHALHRPPSYPRAPSTSTSITLLAVLLAITLAACAPRAATTTPPCLGPDACTRACTSGLATACTRLGDLADHPAGDFSPPRAMRAYLDGCDHGDPTACLAVAAIADELGYPDRVRIFNHRACGLSGPPCNLPRPPHPAPPPISWLLAAEHAEATAPARAHTLYQRACSAGLARACLRAANPAAALTILRRRCTDGWPSACTEANDLTANTVWLTIGDRALDLLLRATTSAW